MELRVLKYFLMVAREENITRAAQRLNVTQPTLSRQLMQMEEELGVKLFKRGKHSISLTEDGILLKQRAQEIINIEEKIREDLSHSDDMLMGNDNHWKRRNLCIEWSCKVGGIIQKRKSESNV